MTNCTGLRLGQFGFVVSIGFRVGVVVRASCLHGLCCKGGVTPPEGLYHFDTASELALELYRESVPRANLSLIFLASSKPEPFITVMGPTLAENRQQNDQTSTQYCCFLGQVQLSIVGEGSRDTSIWPRASEADCRVYNKCQLILRIPAFATKLQGRIP